MIGSSLPSHQFSSVDRHGPTGSSSPHTGGPRLQADRVPRIQIYILPLDDLHRSVWGRQAESFLTSDEMQRAQRLHKPEAQRRWSLCRAAVRQILAHSTSRSPQDIRFVFSANGKPHLPHGPHFNVSHSADLALVAVTDEIQVGIDLELDGPRRNVTAVASLILTSEEQACFWASAPDQRTRLLRRAWVRKEAVLKAAGCGLAADVKSLCVGVDPNVVRQAYFSGAEYHVRDLDFPFAAAIASTRAFDVTIADFADAVKLSTGTSRKAAGLMNQPPSLAVLGAHVSSIL